MAFCHLQQKKIFGLVIDKTASLVFMKPAEGNLES